MGPAEVPLVHSVSSTGYAQQALAYYGPYSRLSATITTQSLECYAHVVSAVVGVAPEFLARRQGLNVEANL